MRDKLTQLTTPTPTEDTMNTDDKNLLQKIEAAKVEMSRFETMLDDINAENDAFLNARWLSALPYVNLVNEAIATNIAERLSAIEWKYKNAVISVWCYRIEAQRRGLLPPTPAKPDFDFPM